MKVLLILLFFSSTCFADNFNSPFLNFDTPPGWACSHLGGSWTCNSPKKSRKQGIIIITTKKAKLGYSLKTYMNRLQKPIKREWNKKMVFSQPQSVEEVTIRNHNWIQATHLNSEIPNSTTKYLVTVKNGLTVLLSFSAHNDDYPSFSNSFIKSIESLKLNPKLAQSRIGPKLEKKANQPNTGLAIGNELDDLFEENPIDGPTTNSGLDDKKKMGIIGLILLAGVFLILSKRRKKKS